MTALGVSRFVNLLLVALFVGFEVGSRFVIHPSLNSLSFNADLEAEQALSRILGRIMPVVMPLTMISTAVVALLISDKTSAEFWLTVAAFACLVVMLAITLTGNVPINDRVLELTPDTPREDWRALRRRWDHLHSARVALDLVALAALILAALQ